VSSHQPSPSPCAWEVSAREGFARPPGSHIRLGIKPSPFFPSVPSICATTCCLFPCQGCRLPLSSVCIQKAISSLQREKVHDASQMSARGSSLQTQQIKGGRWTSNERFLLPVPLLGGGEVLALALFTTLVYETFSMSLGGVSCEPWLSRGTGGGKQNSFRPLLKIHLISPLWLPTTCSKLARSCPLRPSLPGLRLCSWLALVASFFPPLQDFWQGPLLRATFVTGQLGPSSLAEAPDAELVIREIIHSQAAFFYMQAVRPNRVCVLQ